MAPSSKLMLTLSAEILALSLFSATSITDSEVAGLKLQSRHLTSASLGRRRIATGEPMSSYSKLKSLRLWDSLDKKITTHAEYQLDSFLKANGNQDKWGPLLNTQKIKDEVVQDISTDIKRLYESEYHEKAHFTGQYKMPQVTDSDIIPILTRLDREHGYNSNIFGKNIKDYQVETDTSFPKDLLELIEAIKNRSNGYDIVGLFRLSGDASEYAQMRKSKNVDAMLKCSGGDVLNLGIALKDWLGRLPESLIPAEVLANEKPGTDEDSVTWDKIMSFYVSKIAGIISQEAEDDEDTDTATSTSLSTIVLIIELLRAVADQKSNKMGNKQLAVVFAPNLIGVVEGDQASGGHAKNIIENLLETVGSSAAYDNLVKYVKTLGNKNDEYLKRLRSPPAPAPLPPRAEDSNRLGLSDEDDGGDLQAHLAELNLTMLQKIEEGKKHDSSGNTHQEEPQRLQPQQLQVKVSEGAANTDAPASPTATAEPSSSSSLSRSPSNASNLSDLDELRTTRLLGPGEFNKIRHIFAGGDAGVHRTLVPANVRGLSTSLRV